MAFSLLPGIILDSVTQLTPEFLLGRGVSLLMLDFDNTIVPYTTDIPTEEMAAWLERMAVSDVTVCVVSNSKNDRVRRFCKHLDIPCVTHARKPFSRGIRQCLEKFGKKPEEAALAGDQIFTDTLGANGCGVLPILVAAIDNHNFWLKARHVLELPFIAMASKRRVDL